MIASDLKHGMALRIEGQVYQVLEAGFKAGAGQAGGIVKAKLRNAMTGRFWETHFRPDVRLEQLTLDRETMEFLYSDDANCTFRHPETFEQVEVPRAVIGAAEKFPQPGMRLPIEFFDGRPVSIVFPAIVELRVADTPPAVHSQQDSAWKEATLENGVKLIVPLFVERDGVVRVDAQTGRYLEGVRLERKRGA